MNVQGASHPPDSADTQCAANANAFDGAASGRHWGAERLATGRTRFRLWAPDCRRVWLDMAGHEPLAMTTIDDGFFETVAPVGAGTVYGYRLDAPDGMLIPDPASRAQHDDVDGCSRVVDPCSYAWRCNDWRGRPWHEAVVYEAHAGLMGGFEVMRRRLDEWAALGVTAVELMPVNAFPGKRNWGYDGALIYAPETTYGAPDQLKALIDAAHERGLMMLLDVVYNHFGPQGNYLSRYASGFFREDRSTPWGPAIDFRVAPVRDFLSRTRCTG